MKIYYQVLVNIAIIFLFYTVCRVEFLWENAGMFSVAWGSPHFWQLLQSGLLFDASAICYTNVLYLTVLLLPWHQKEKNGVHQAAKWIYVIINSLALGINLIDSVYYPYSLHRTTTKVFNEFAENDNLGTIFGIEVVNHWYLVVLFVAMVAALWCCYRPTTAKKPAYLRRYYLTRIPGFVVIGYLAVCGMRGNFGYTSTRPIAISNAHQYVMDPTETAIVLNTPFSLIRTINKKPAPAPHFYDSAELDSLYTPVHLPNDSIAPKRKNVVILIVESFADEFIGYFNHHLDHGTYQGYTPFIDSLIPRCLTSEYTVCNTTISIDAMPAVLASIPRGEDHFILSPYSLDHINSIATELKHWGYESAFFHGADNGSMGFEAFASQAGFDRYLGRTEYNQDSRFDGDKDFDGTWAIWDEEFLQFYALKMSEMQEPFVTSCFTASSHHPFRLPERYKSVFPEEGTWPMHKCIRYADYSLRRFFETAEKQPWFKNTIFVITADHASSKRTHEEFKVGIGYDKIRILFYDPSQELASEVRQDVMQQIDIMPTLLGYLGYDRPYIAFGRNVLDAGQQDGWAVNWAPNPRFYTDDYFLNMNMDGTVIGFYDYRNDPLCETDLSAERPEELHQVLTKAKAFIQSYFERMEGDSLQIEH